LTTFFGFAAAAFATGFDFFATLALVGGFAAGFAEVLAGAFEAAAFADGPLAFDAAFARGEEAFDFAPEWAPERAPEGAAGREDEDFGDVLTG
jgi:hypothetical protein